MVFGLHVLDHINCVAKVSPQLLVLLESLFLLLLLFLQQRFADNDLLQFIRLVGFFVDSSSYLPSLEEMGGFGWKGREENIIQGR